MLKSAGIHQNFGWKPIGKYDFTVGANSHLIDPLPCDFERTVLMVTSWDLGGVHIRVNEDAGANYDYTYHQHGAGGGAAYHLQDRLSGQAQIKFSQNNRDNPFTISYLQKRGNMLNIISQSSCYTDNANYELCDLAAFYPIAGPYTQLRFSRIIGGNIVGQVELFESVYGF